MIPIDASWLKALYLQVGDEIAVANESRVMSHEPYVWWAKIGSIEYVGYEHVYDIEVEGTHNFIANGIVAHNTYMSGNVGIGTTSPSVKLDVAGGDVALQTAKKVILDSNDTGDASNTYFVHDAVNNRTDIYVDGNRIAWFKKE